jgi:threonine dehydrogenase-like Zn-dependent dehydrogenase
VSCIGCNQGCVSRIAVQLDVTCLVNPSCGRELELVSRPSGERRTVLVVGAGPGGMEAARVAAERGHRVVLVDREPAVGGRLRAAAQLPHREGWQVFIREGAARLERAGVELRLGVEADAALVAELAPDAVVAAVGAAAPRGDAVPLLENGPGDVRRAVVLGSGPVALNVAEWLAVNGAEAVVVSAGAELSEDGQPGLLDRVLATGRVSVRLERELRTADAGAVTIVRTGAIGPLDEERLEAVDAVVETSVAAPVPIPEWLAAAVPPDRLHAVGDCRSPRTALEAIHEGALAGLAV